MSSSSSSSSSSPPPTIGPYTISREIGKGSFAVVHRGHYKDGPESRRRPVAIKIVTRRKLTQKLLDNLEGEIAILKTVSHPNIVELIDCLKTDSHIYLVMHFSAGGDLSQYIRRKGVLANLDDQDPSSSLSMSRSFIEATKRYPHPTDGGLHDAVVRSFLEQLASAMQFMRARNIVHRDIKPQNLLLQPPDPTCLSTGHPPGIPQMKVADFGFARSLPAASLAETLCGSPLYMAPEILRYEKYDAKADLWSIGAVTYEMVVGKPPFRASNHVELLRRIERNDDRIRFPDERSEATWLREVEKRREAGEVVSGEEERRGPTKVKEDLKGLIRGLLKRVPVERMSFEEFFGSKVILGARPAGAAKMVGGETTETVVAAGEAQAAKPVSPPRPTPGPALPLQPPSSTRVQAPPPLPPMPPLPKFPPKYIVSRGEASSSSTTATPGKAGRSTTSGATTESAAATATSPRPPSPSPTPSPTPSQVAITPATPTTPSSTTAGGAAPPQEDSDSDSQYVFIDKGTLPDTSTALAAEELSRSPSTTATSSATGRSPLSAQAQGAVSAAARLARRPSRLTKLSSGFSAAVGVGGTQGREAVAPTSSGGGGGGGGLSPTSPRSATATLTPTPTPLASSPRPALTPLPVSSATGGASPAPALSTSPSAPFALPPGVRRQSFASRRVSSSSSGSMGGSFGAAAPAVEQEKQLQQQQQATTYPAPTTSPQPLAQQQQPPAPSSALSRALSQASQASQKLFGIPSGMSLLGALALVRGAGTVSSLPTSTSAALTTTAGSGGAALAQRGPDSASPPPVEDEQQQQEAEEKEAQLLLRLDDLGQKAYVLCEFADAKMCAVFGEAWTNFSTGSGFVAPGGGGVGSISGSASSSLLAEGPGTMGAVGVAQRYQQRSPSFGGVGASPPQYTSNAHSFSSTGDEHHHLHLTQVTSESLQIYIKSLSFLQAGIEAVRAHLAASASATRRAAAASGGSNNNVGVVAVEINEAVQYLRRRFAETMEKAEAVRSRQRAIPTPGPSRHTTTNTGAGGAVVAGGGGMVGVNVEKVIYDKAMELARAAAVDELEHQSQSASRSPATAAVEIRSTAAGESPGTPPGATTTTTGGAAAGSGGGGGAGWDMQACLLAYETAEIMLSTLIDDHPGGGSGGVGGAALTVQPFIKSISHRCQILRGRVADARVGG